jgi:hypothetical protein
VSGREIVAFSKNGEYEGKLLIDGSVSARHVEYDKLFTLRKSEIEVLNFVK